MKRGLITIDDFYYFLYESRNLKKKIFKNLLNNGKVNNDEIKKLEGFLKTIKNSKKEKGSFVLLTKDDKKIYTDLKYSIIELEKDIVYLKYGKPKLESVFFDKKSFEQKNRIVRYLLGKRIDSIVSDRDGTINNYSERYSSSVQSSYNAYFLWNYIGDLKNKILLSSAPLHDFLKVNILPEKNVLIAGSKGREHKYKGNIKRIPIQEKKLVKINDLSSEIKRILNNSYYEKFKHIGSGFQEKYGEITVARQDMLGSVGKEESLDLLRKIKETVLNIDPEEKYFSVRDTGKDIEITLKIENKSFSKSLGTEYIIHDSGLKLKNTLVCGDTKSDLSLLKKVKDLSKECYSIFVTEDNELKKEVKKIAPEAKFVSSPDVLVSALDEVSK